MTINTACSSSLTALHLACAALRQGQLRSGAGGRRAGYEHAPGGICYCFRPRAGVRRSVQEFSIALMAPAGVKAAGVVLKRQSDAERDGDAILALIRGSAVKQDGAEPGIDGAEWSQSAAGDPSGVVGERSGAE